MRRSRWLPYNGLACFHKAGLSLIPDEQKTGALNGPAKAFSVKMPLVAQSVGYVSRYGPVRMERSTRDIVARTSYLEITEGRGTPARGVWINVSHIGQAEVKRLFPGMVARTRLIGRDLACEPGKV